MTPLFSALAAMFLLLLTMAFGLLGHFYDIGVYTWVGSAICAVVSILALAVQEWMSR